jgi:hypothetical protein
VTAASSNIRDDLTEVRPPGGLGPRTGSLERRSGISSLLASARDATQVLLEVEQYLAKEWKRLIDQQQQAQPSHIAGDVLYHVKGGWAFVVDQTEVMDGTKIRVYRQNKAAEAKVQVGFYLNVTQASMKDQKLSEWLKRIKKFGD